MGNLELLAKHELVATLEATGEQLDVVADLARALPSLRIVVDHFGWPQNPSEEELPRHRERLPRSLRRPTPRRVSMRSGRSSAIARTDRVRPWLRTTTKTFGAERCMLGSDMPIERLRSGFGRLYDAYREIFVDLTDAARDAVFGWTAQRWYRVGA